MLFTIPSGVAPPRALAGEVVSWQPRIGQWLPSAAPVTPAATCSHDDDCRSCYVDGDGGRRCQDWAAACLDGHLDLVPGPRPQAA